MTQQTHGTPELKYSEETFRDMYETLKGIKELAKGYTEMPKDIILKAIGKALAKAEGR